MNKQEILEEINKTKEHLANMEKMLAECEYERWKPEYMQEYWYANALGGVYRGVWADYDIDLDKYRFYNCFQTREQAEAEAEKILVRRQLEDIARKLNKGRVIDHYKNCLFKYYLYLNCDNKICYGNHISISIQGIVYCLEGEGFKDVAIQEIGEERLKKYLRGE